jgi:Dienelactone hydrolase family
MDDKLKIWTAVGSAEVSIKPISTGCAAEPIVVSPANVGPPRSGAAHELYQPVGSGPHPAILVLHGCSGVTPAVRQWAATMAEWGYLALVLDSFGPRGVQNVCDRPDHVSAWLRAQDAFAGAAYLRPCGRACRESICILILIGDADDWTPVERCQWFQWVGRPR